MSNKVTYCVIGGGFYGCTLALWLRNKVGSRGADVLLVEKEQDLMTRASAINQARVHTGFHYPRSLATAIRSLVNFPHFVFEFRKAIVDNFTMLYAIARQGSKVNAQRFYKTYTEMKAPIRMATQEQKNLFSASLIEDVFAVDEYAFDYTIIRQQLREKLEQAGVRLLLGTEVTALAPEAVPSTAGAGGAGAGSVCGAGGAGTRIRTTQNEFVADVVFNCTYSRINSLLQASGQDMLPLKHEITEMVLIRPPEELRGLAVTVMDGPFFSMMPYPSREAYSLSHVRFTPHEQWRDGTPCFDPHQKLTQTASESNYQYMRCDVQRYMPRVQLHCIEPMFEVKTVLIRNEVDDGRPILCEPHPQLGQVYTVMGSKLDNVYDLFERLGDIVNLAKNAR